MTAFDPLSVPLSGTHLVEAGAGTGKTHGLTALYVRLVAEGALAPREIAVVTFTEAATRELKVRVRQRLAALAARLSGHPDAARAPDAQLDALHARIAGDPRAVQRVRDAALALDEAAIATIHGYARRVLQDFALEAAAPFVELEPGDGLLARGQAVADFWRRTVIAGDPAEAAWILSWCQSPRALEALLEPLLRIDPDHWLPQLASGDLERAGMALERARRDGMAHAAHLEEAFDQASGSGRVSIDKSKSPYAPGRRAASVAPILAWLDGEAAAPPAPAALVTYTRAGLAQFGKGKVRHEPSHGALYDWAERALAGVLEHARLRRAALLARAARSVRERVARTRRERRTTSFDALVEDFARLVALPGMVAAIRARYRVAIVDEFQDTDAEQYAIFRALFHGRDDGGLYLIGDPKQAIYRFRGGDVFAYARAARDAGANRWTLTDNWRSDARLIAAVNALFDERRVPAPFVHGFIRFLPSRYGEPRAEKASAVSLDPQPMRVWTLEDAGAKADEVKARLYAAIAVEIAMLLRGNAAAGAAPGAGAARARAPRIAILLRDRFEIDACMAELSRWRIPAAASTTAVVYETREAEEMLVVLAALAAPRDLRRARAALATDALGYDDAALLALQQSSEALERALAEVGALRDGVLAHGPAALARALAQHAGPRWLGRADGRRRLANLLQLGALLQQKWATLDGLGGLIACLERERATRGFREEAELKPEAGHAEVEVLTIHKSKGLEWDVVFVPTLWLGRAGAARGRLHEVDALAPVVFHAPDGGLRVDVGSADWEAHAEQQAEELHAESVRLAYVALTRAKHRCHFFWGAVGKTVEGSPLARLLHPARDGAEPAFDADGVAAALENWRDAADGAVSIEPLPERCEPVPLARPAVAEVAARRFRGRIDRSFQLLSFSALIGAAEELPDHDQRIAEVPLDLPGPVPALPRGASFGECVHAVLERVPYATIAAAGRDPRAAREIAAVAARYGYDGNAAAYVRELAVATVGCELAPAITLAALPPHAVRAELEFFFPLAGARIAAIGAALALAPRYRRDEAELAALAPRWSGLMHGYVDLVYCVEGRAGLVDYKTNYLGSRYADYDAAALAAVVRAHDYDLQYLIYVVAYVRHLKLRLGAGFDYERDFDGVAYLFVRGLAGGEGVHRDKPPHAVIAALDAAFGGHDAGASRGAGAAR